MRDERRDAWERDLFRLVQDEVAQDVLNEHFSSLERLEAENAKLRELCSELLRMAESNDPDFLHWPEMHEELRKLGVKIVKL